MTPKQTLKNWFSNLKKPTQNHFWAWLDSYFHKEEKIPMSQIEGLDKALQDTASSTQINNHLTDNQAHKELFDLKVDKIVGKRLSTEDFTSEYKEKLERLQNVDVSHLLEKGTFEGTAQDLKTAIDNVLTILHSPDTTLDTLQEIVDYIKQNRTTLSQLGISNIAGLERVLAEKASATHTHSWSEITDKPVLITEQDVDNQIDKIQIGTRNLLKNSNRVTSNANYMIAGYHITEPLQNNEWVTCTLKGTLGEGKTQFAIYNSNGFTEIGWLNPIGNGLHRGCFLWKKGGTNSSLLVYVIKENVVSASTISWIKLERGNKATDWLPAPENIFIENIKYLTQDKLNTFEELKSGSYPVTQNGGSGILLNFNAWGSVSSLQFYKPNWYNTTRLQVRNTIDNNRLSGNFQELAWLSDVNNIIYAMDKNDSAPLTYDHIGRTLVYAGSTELVIELGDLPNNATFSVVKENATARVKFAGKTIVGDTNGIIGGAYSSASVIIRGDKAIVLVNNRS